MLGRLTYRALELYWLYWLCRMADVGNVDAADGWTEAELRFFWLMNRVLSFAELWADF